MDTHVNIEVIEVFNGTPKLVKAFYLARLIALVQNLEDLLDELERRLDLGKLLHIT